MILQTERLLLVEASLEDAGLFFELLNSRGWIENIGDRKIKTMKDASGYISKSLIASYEKNGFGLYKMVLKKELSAVGICGLLKRKELDNPDLGFALLPTYYRLGLAYEASNALLAYAKTELGLNQILAIVNPKNIASRKLLSKLGMEEDSSNIPLDSNFKDVLLYSKKI